MNANLFSLIRRRLPPAARPFLETPDGRGLSYGGLLEGSGRFAAALGVRPGERVAAQIDKSPEALLLYLACLRAGAVYLPLNGDYTAAELAYFLGDAEPSVFVCTPGKRAGLEGVAAAAGVPRLETLAADGTGSFAAAAARARPMEGEAERGPDDLAALLYTSGTTGRAKGAMISHRNLASNAEALVAAWRFTGDDVLLHALPLFHSHGLFVAGNVTLLAGAKMLFLPRFDLDALFGQLPRASAMMGVPTFYSRLLGDPRLTGAAVAHMRLFVSGSAPLSPEVHRAFAARTGHAILERYGMTETNMITSNPYDGERRPGTVGLALPGVELRITGRTDGTVLPAGEVGAVEVRGPNVFQGYWRQPEKTRAAFRDDGFFVTGDLGRLDEAGYLALVGRDKDLIITGGYNVYPAEVEAALDALEGIAESAVIGLPHGDFGEAVTAVVARAPAAGVGEAEISEAGIRARLAGKLARYKLPKRVLFVDRLPRNAMGKVDKKTLRATYRDTY